MKKILFHKMSYYPEPDSPSRNEIKVKSDLSNSATRPNIETATDVDTSEFTKRVVLASFVSKVEKLNVNKQETVSINLNKLSNVVKNNVVKKLCIINWSQSQCYWC